MGISGTQLEITAEFSGTSSEPFGVSVLSGSGGKTNLVVDQTRDYVLIDGTAQGNPKPRAGPILGGSDKVWSKCSSSLGGCFRRLGLNKLLQCTHSSTATRSR